MAGSANKLIIGHSKNIEIALRRLAIANRLERGKVTQSGKRKRVEIEMSEQLLQAIYEEIKSLHMQVFILNMAFCWWWLFWAWGKYKASCRRSHGPALDGQAVNPGEAEHKQGEFESAC